MKFMAIASKLHVFFIRFNRLLFYFDRISNCDIPHLMFGSYDDSNYPLILNTGRNIHISRGALSM